MPGQDRRSGHRPADGETLVIDWDEVQKFGADALLVNTELPEDGAAEAKKPGLLDRLLGR